MYVHPFLKTKYTVAENRFLVGHVLINAEHQKNYLL